MNREGPLRLTVSVRSWRVLLTGAGLIALSFCMPLLFTVHNFRVRFFLNLALHTQDRLDLIDAALRLVALNAVRALPHYCGAFLAADALDFRLGPRNAWPCNAGLILLLLYATYRSIDMVYGIYYDFGLPALAAAILIILFEKMDYRYISMLKKTGFVAMELLVWQFLDVMPAADVLPVGRGEMSQSIKLAGRLLDAESALNTMGMIGILLFAAYALLFFILLRDENYLREMDALREQNTAIRAKARLNEARNRTYQEIQHLVHDLKSPLTVIQTLVGVCKLECQQSPPDPQVRAQTEERLELLSRVENAVEQMSQMISEILYEQKTTLTTVEHILRRSSAQISIEDYAPYVHMTVNCPQAQIRVNSILFSRGLANLVQNAAHAAHPDRTLRIDIQADAEEDQVRFQVIDNGRGISEEKLRSIWDRGYSGSDSSGLGLFFVRNVVEQMGGRIALQSAQGKGTTISIWLPKEGEKHGTSHDFVH